MFAFLKHKNILYLFFGFLVCLQVFQLFFFNRSVFLSRYDVSYWKSRVEHSQWVLPLSKRIIGDDGLFAYVGYTLIHGADPTWLNAETGPTGKYLLGFSILLFGNPYIISYLLVVLCALLLFLLSKKLLRTTLLSLFVVLLFLTDPIITSEISTSSIDIIQIFFLLLFFFCWIKVFEKRYALFFAGIAGIALGLFATVKLPISFPILFVAILASFTIKKYFKESIIFLIFLFVGFTFPYLHYFHLHPSIVDFIKLQKYIISFYLKSKLTVHHLAIWQVIFTKQFPDIAQGTATPLSEWSMLWATGVIAAGVTALWMLYRKKKQYWMVFVLLYLFLSLLFFSFIPIYPRYLLLLTPFLYLVVGYCIFLCSPKKVLPYILVGISLYTSIVSFGLLMPSRDTVYNDFTYNLSRGFFEDIYQEDIANASGLHLGREAFNDLAQKAFFDAQIQQVVFRPISRVEKRNTASILGTFIYTTRNLGTFSEKKKISLQLQNGTWKIVWDWNYLVDDFAPQDRMVTQVTIGKRGSIVDQQGNVLVEDEGGLVVLVKPSAIDPKQENAMLSLMAKISGVKAVHLQNAYLENPTKNVYIPLFTPFFPVDAATSALLASFPGVQLQEYPNRVYTSDAIGTVVNTRYGECCTRIYSSTNYHGVAGWEKIYDTMLSGNNGGSLILEDKKGNIIRRVITRMAKDGENVMVHL